jgi:2-oxoglutarate ferredoxin oxidoreductase subunit alpha
MKKYFKIMIIKKEKQKSNRSSKFEFDEIEGGIALGQACYTLLFGGEAGYGVMSAGAMTAKGATRNGLWTMVVNEYPSLIKGGLNTCLVRIGEKPLTSYEEELDFLGALSQPAFDLNADKVKAGGILLFDAKTVIPNRNLVRDGVVLLPVELLQTLTKDSAKVMANSALLGGFCALSGFPKEIITAVMTNEFHNEEIRAQNIEILESAYEMVSKIVMETPVFPIPLNRLSKESKMLINGNEAIAMGALQAGCRFSAGYPMTPGSSVLTYLAEQGPRYGLVFKQAEDEIAAINMLIGAAFAGARSLGSTSGGGFALMTEALGFAAQAEVPIVLVNAQRGGPSTGLPTRTAQADLNFVLHASQGEFPRIIVAPGDVEECFYETFRIFNLTERYQVPGIILTDKYLADSSVSTPFFATEELVIDRGKLATDAELIQQPYLRYKITEDGVSPRAVPGQAGGRHIATSYTHGEDGFYSSGNREYAGLEPEITKAMLDKWYSKVPLMVEQLPGIKLYGPETADLTVIAWGSTKGAVMEAMQAANALGLVVNFLQILYIAPFPAAAVEKVLGQVKRSLLVEGNKTAQLGGLIRANTGYKANDVYLKYDSRPFTPAVILAKIKEVLS